jgi:ligand-binding sensor domain-containing protein
MMSIRHILIICVFLFQTIQLLSQSPHFYHYDTNEGLPSNECYDIKQDSKGYIWIATDRGVCRYDGYKFTTFTSEDGLMDNTVFTIEEDSLGRIWFLSFNGKLCWYKDGKIEPYKYNSVFDKLYTGTKIARSFYVDKKGGVTISYLNHGILQVSPDGTYKKTENPTLSLSFFAYNLKNKLMLGSWQGPNLKPTAYYFYTNFSPEPKLINITRQSGMWNIRGLKRKNGTYVFSMIKNIIELNKDKEKISDSNKDITTLFEDSDSCLWVGIHKGGILKYEANLNFDDRKPENYLFGLTVTSVTQDKEGSYWFTTLEDGVYYISTRSMRLVKMSEVSYKNVVTDITGDGRNTIYAGSINGDILKLNSGSLQSEKTDTSFGFVQKLFFNRSTKELWVGTREFFGKYPGNKSFSILKRFPMREICNLPNGDMIGIFGVKIAKVVNDSVFFFENNQGRTFRPDVIKPDNHNKIWIGNTNGLYYLRVNSIVKDTSFIKTERVIDIGITADDRLVVATIGSGIFIRGQNGILHIGTAQGLISNIVNGIFIEGKQLWLATNKGISCVTLNGNNYSIRNYGLSNGVPTNDIRQIYLQNNKVWLATNMGLVVFDPTQIPISFDPVPVYLEKIKVNANPIGNQTVFSYDQNFIEFDYTAISFKQRGTILYRYRLVGSKDTWTETNNTNVQFASLKPGDYRFELLAKNEDDIWNKSPVIFPFVINAPFWQKPVFLVIIFLFLFGITFLWYAYRLRQIRNRNKLVLQLQEYQKQALASQINPHFIFNSLNSIHAFILSEERKDASKYLSSFSKLIRKCLEHSSKEYVPIKEERDLLTTYLDLEVMRFKQKFIYHIEIDPAILNSAIQIPSMLLQPYIENSIYHGIMPLENKQGIITIRVFFANQFLKCEIEDNGIGRETAQQKKQTVHESKGTDLTEKRMKVYKENDNYRFSLEIVDLYDTGNKACGTKVVFNLPYITS